MSRPAAAATRLCRATPHPVGRVRARSLRGLLIGLILVPLNVIWITEAEFYRGLGLSMMPVYPTPIFILALLLGLNLLLRRLRPGSALAAWELLVIYIMLSISCTITSQDFSLNLGAIITSAGLPVSYPLLGDLSASSSLAHLRPWLLVSDPDALQDFIGGRASLYHGGAWRVWLSPVLVWSGFIAVLLSGLLAIAYLLQRRWREELRLSFPVARVPLSICPVGTGGGARWSGRRLLPGIAVSLVLATLQGIKQNYPSVPAINTGIHFLYFPTHPWNVLSSWPTAYCFSPFAIGISYFVPTNVLFSCWFFHLVSLATRVAENQWLLNSAESTTFYLLDERMMGAWLAMGVFLVYESRAVLGRTIRAWAGGGAGEKDTGLDSRVALAAVVVITLVLVLFWGRIGMPAAFALLTVVAYWLVSLVAGVVRVQAGAPHLAWDAEPMRLAAVLGPGLFSSRAIAVIGITHWFWRRNRVNPMPGMLEGFKLAEAAGARTASLVAPMLAAAVVAAVTSIWWFIQVGYREGAMTGCRAYPGWTILEVEQWLRFAFEGHPGGSIATWSKIAVGGSVVYLLAALQARFTWFPLSPIGWCVGPTLSYFSTPIFLAWLVKTLLLRYGGRRLYDSAVPFFLGLVVGDLIAASGWSLLIMAFGIRGYNLMA